MKVKNDYEGKIKCRIENRLSSKVQKFNFRVAVPLVPPPGSPLAFWMGIDVSWKRSRNKQIDMYEDIY